MLNWLRRRFGRFNRRWIDDPEERERHREIVERRLPGSKDPAEKPRKTSPGGRD